MGFCHREKDSVYRLSFCWPTQKEGASLLPCNNSSAVGDRELLRWGSNQCVRLKRTRASHGRAKECLV